ncbi:hypothetical protein CMV37_32505 [Bacillus cereus]|nr:hypothetical protein CMV37_32505 [Bacillus cereus]
MCIFRQNLETKNFFESLKSLQNRQNLFKKRIDSIKKIVFLKKYYTIDKKKKCFLYDKSILHRRNYTRKYILCIVLDE